MEKRTPCISQFAIYFSDRLNLDIAVSINRFNASVLPEITKQGYGEIKNLRYPWQNCHLCSGHCALSTKNRYSLNFRRV